MGLEQRTWQAVGLLRSTGGRREAHLELWYELCAELEAVIQNPRYVELCATGDGVPDDCFRFA